MSECSILMLTMLFARLDDTDRLTAARCCNATFYPCIPDDSSEESMARFRRSESDFAAHVRFYNSDLFSRFYSFFRSCGDCLERYSSLRCHHVRSDLAFALICSFLRRAVLTHVIRKTDDGSEYLTFLMVLVAPPRVLRCLESMLCFFQVVLSVGMKPPMLILQPGKFYLILCKKMNFLKYNFILVVERCRICLSLRIW